MSAADELRPSARPMALEPSPLVDRLLMSGLDEYFAGRYERAIQVWSRVFFLDRSHARARAYIDRARSALAETLREAEARGRAPEGDLEPRSLFGSFGPEVANASAPDPVLAVHGALAALPRRVSGPGRIVPPSATAPVGRRRLARRRVGHGVLVIVAGVLLFGAGYTVAARNRLAQWWQSARLDKAAGASALAGALGVRSSEEVLGRVREHLERGRFDEALGALSTIRADDPRRHEADALREEVRRAVATGAAPAARRPIGRPAPGGLESR